MKTRTDRDDYAQKGQYGGGQINLKKKVEEKIEGSIAKDL